MATLVCKAFNAGWLFLAPEADQIVNEGVERREQPARPHDPDHWRRQKRRPLSRLGPLAGPSSA